MWARSIVFVSSLFSDIRSVCYCFGLQETLKCAMPSIWESIINLYIASIHIICDSFERAWVSMSLALSFTTQHTYSAELLFFVCVWNGLMRMNVHFVCTRFESFVTGFEFQWNDFVAVFFLFLFIVFWFN